MKRTQSISVLNLCILSVFILATAPTISGQTDQGGAKCAPSCTQASPPPPPPPVPCPPPPALPPPPPPPSPPPSPKKPSPSKYCPPPPSSYIYITGPPGNLYPIDESFNAVGKNFAGGLSLLACFGILGLLILW